MTSILEHCYEVLLTSLFDFTEYLNATSNRNEVLSQIQTITRKEANNLLEFLETWKTEILSEIDSIEYQSSTPTLQSKEET